MRRSLEARRSCIVAPFADDNVGIEIYSRRNDDSRRVIYASESSFDADNDPSARQYLARFALKDRYVLFVFDNVFHRMMVRYLIRLSSQRVNGRSFPEIEHTKLQGSSVGVESHFSAESVDLANKMPFCRSAYRRIARHKRYGVERKSQKKRLMPLSCRRKRGFYARVSAAYNYRIENVIFCGDVRKIIFIC